MIFFLVGFSLLTWKMNHSLGPHEAMSDIMKARLDEHLGLPGYRKQRKCSRNSSPYWPTYNGWKEGKNLFVDQL